MFGYFEKKANEVWSMVAPETSPVDEFIDFLVNAQLDMSVSKLQPYIAELQQFPDLSTSALSQNQNLLLQKSLKGNVLIQELALNGKLELVRLFFNSNVPSYTSIKNGNGESLLHLAARSGNADLVHFLLENGFKISDKSYTGHTAYQVCKGFSLQQKLLQILMKEEQESSPSDQQQPQAFLGASRDPKLDEERLKNLAPPPTGIKYNYKRAPRRRKVKEIKEDGFVTTVGNLELSKKYGNKTTFQPVDLGAASDAGSEKSEKTTQSVKSEKIGMTRKPRVLRKPPKRYSPFGINGQTAQVVQMQTK
eukprot:augustus_masked-scaffold_69-processed-gene-0.65-mRNA-1 protein AED:1.00 eAED:1.00 QI:0/-1/0/0/-1/1/1/0/306